MTSQLFNWKRFWCPRTGSINLSDGGYLSDPDTQWGQALNPDLVSFESIAEVPCLALLGEPGIGKTYAMELERQNIETVLKAKGEEILWRNLRAYGIENRLVYDLFESTSFVSWVGGTHQLNIFLDSLDECLLRIDNLAALLIEELKKYPIERLNFRIACRTADWPNGLEVGLEKLWGHDLVKVFELAPLRRKDVILAAKTHELDHEKFLQEIDRMKAVPLAIKPVTLRFLINSYSRGGHLPDTQAQLYLEGCRILCEESSESRRDARRTGDFTAEQRMAVAARIACISVFANRYAIWTGVDQGDVPDEDVTVSKLCGGIEQLNGEQLQVREAAVKETIDTGLFSSRGGNRMGWAHQTYAEFLAARYLVKHEMSLTQTMSLLCHPYDPEKKLVPQLHETAAWLAGMQPDAFREIMKLDPEVLLRSDVATADVEDRAALVGSLLKLYDEERLLDRDPDIRRLYRKLNHPELAEQLRPYIFDSSKGIIVRRVAIDIAEACETRTLQNELAEIALDQTQPLPIRVEAAYAAGRIADTATKARMKPLITGEASDDPDDELKGCALRALWPDHMTAGELFGVLTAPKRDDFIGAYYRFISHDLAQHISPADLPIALEWTAEQESRHQLAYSIREFIDNIMLLGWKHLESTGVLPAFAKTVISRIKHHDEIIEDRKNQEFKNDLINEDEKRHLIINAIIPLLLDLEQDLIWQLARARTPIVLPKDVLWMTEQLTTKPEGIQRALAQLILFAFNIKDRCHIDAILNASKDNPILANKFEALINPIELNSPEAQRIKENYLKIHEWEQDEKQLLLEPPPAERIALLLDECESGEVAAWWRLNRDMTLKQDSTRYDLYEEFESDLTVLPGWIEASEVTRARIVKVAEQYLLKKDPAKDKWLGTNAFHRPAAAGYRALRLLHQEAPGVFASLPRHVWKKWAPIILAYPTSNESEEETIHDILVKIAYQHAPDEILKTLIVLIDKEDKEHDYIFITHKVENCWDDRLADALLIKLKKKKLKPGSMSCLLRELVEHKVYEAKTFAETLIPIPPPSNVDERLRAIAAACELLSYADDAGWSVVWPAIQQDEEFGREVIEKVSQSDRHANIGQRLAENHLEELYIWLVRQFPYNKDLKNEDIHRGGDIAEWRDSILRHLQNRGTYQACESIQRISDTFPELDWLKWTLFEAQTIARRLTWIRIPPRVDDILRLAKDSLNRLIQNGNQLLDVLIESLKRLEEKLQGETPFVQFLWDKNRPKDEHQFSDFVKIHLDDDLKKRGIIVNREVRIHRGERTDIHVDAVLQDQQGGLLDSIAVIIELKGCWNSELNNAMETQLVNQYLKNNRCQHGLYLVGWYNCEQWDSSDYRKKQAPSLTKDESQKQFDAQANELSQHGTMIKAFVINTALG
jgi:predicted NACHT family NTPase